MADQQDLWPAALSPGQAVSDCTAAGFYHGRQRAIEMPRIIAVLQFFQLIDSADSMRSILNITRLVALVGCFCSLPVGFGISNHHRLAADQPWRQLDDMPVGKWESGTVVYKDQLFLFGGYTPGVKSSKRCDVYDPATKSWRGMQDLPSAVTHMNMVLDGDVVWYAGGFKDGYKGHTIAEVWQYDLKQDRYTAAPLLPETRGGGGLAIVNRKLHYFGGVKQDRDTDAADHWVLDLDQWKGGGAVDWQAAAPMPAPRNQFSVVTLDQKIYAIGGQFHHDSGQHDQPRVDVYDPTTNRWSRGPDLPKGHSHSEGGTFVHERIIYVVGGHSTPAGGRKNIEADILALPPDGQWQVVATLPMPLSSPSAAIISGKLYVAGGSPDGRSVQARMWVRQAP